MADAAVKLPKARIGVILQEDKDDIFLVDTDGGEVFHINQTSARIFSYCQREMTLDAAVAELVAGLAIAGQEAEVRQDVEETVLEFQRLGLCDAATQSG